MNNCNDDYSSQLTAKNRNNNLETFFIREHIISPGYYVITGFFVGNL